MKVALLLIVALLAMGCASWSPGEIRASGESLVVEKTCRKMETVTSTSYNEAGSVTVVTETGTDCVEKHVEGGKGSAELWKTALQFIVMIGAAVALAL
jgi:hypothetical protein